MNRETALRLLRGGAEGVQEWNRRRSAGETVPDLKGVNLNPSSPETKNIRGADLSGIQLEGAKLSNVDLTGANLKGALLVDLDAYHVTLDKANLRGANLIGAYLWNASLIRTRLNGSFLQGANLTGADMTSADLTGANLEHAILVNTNLQNAIIEDCRVYGTAVWDVNLKGARQNGLLVASTHKDQQLTVDNLEVAQFIYLLLHNERLRDVIDTITSKVVLILGRFTPERKSILEAVRNRLRERDYLPVLFDFQKPRSRDVTETISILAHISRFVIADITNARSIPQELEAIVPHLPSVPIQPLLQASADEYGMFEHFNRYPWVLTLNHYTGIDDLMAGFQEKILQPLETLAQRNERDTPTIARTLRRSRKPAPRA